jgi:hypothetical protein
VGDARLRVLRGFGGWSRLWVTLIDNKDSDLGAHQDVAIGIPVVCSPSGALPFLARIVGSRHPRAGRLILFSAVSSEAAREIAVGVHGVPTLTAEIDVESTDGRVACRVVLDGAELLRLVVRKGTRYRLRHDRTALYSPRDGASARAMIETQALVTDRRGHGCAEVVPGSGRFADLLRSLELGPAVRAEYAPRRSATLYAPEPLEIGNETVNTAPPEGPFDAEISPPTL